MKLKTLILLERGMSMGYSSMSSQDTQLRPMPGGMDDTIDWNGIVEGDGWFLYKEANNWHKREAGASITITEGKPHKFKIKIKTRGLKKAKDTNAMLSERVKKHTDKVSGAWIASAKRIRNNPHLNEIGEPLQKSWAQCFKEALEDPKVKPFIESFEENQVSVDPVNFTPRI